MIEIIEFLKLLNEKIITENAKIAVQEFILSDEFKRIDPTLNNQIALLLTSFFKDEIESLESILNVVPRDFKIEKPLKIEDSRFWASLSYMNYLKPNSGYIERLNNLIKLKKMFEAQSGIVPVEVNTVIEGEQRLKLYSSRLKIVHNPSQQSRRIQEKYSLR